MKTIIVASHNPVKIQAARSGFEKMFPEQQFQTDALSSPSGVKDQPLSNDETFQGAMNRSFHASQLAPQADYWIGIEGGIEERGGEFTAFAWVVIYGKSLDGKLVVGKGRTGTFFIPPPVADLIRQGKELGEADDIVFRRNNSKQENGAVGLLTGNVIDRKELYEQAVILALIPFKNTALYTKTVLE
jgi:inosine/xanthosine triphosphatase